MLYAGNKGVTLEVQYDVTPTTSFLLMLLYLCVKSELKIVLFMNT